MSEYEELKVRLERDENAFLKIQSQANRQHADSLNQIADMAAFIQRLMQRLDKMAKRIETLERKSEGRVHDG